MFTNPLLVPGLAEELGRGVLGLVLGKVEAEGLEGDGLGDGRGRSGAGRAGGREGGGRGGEGKDEALREGSHCFLIAAKSVINFRYNATQGAAVAGKGRPCSSSSVAR